MLAAYAYCRIADDIVDDAPATGLDATEALGRWAAQLAEPSDPVAVAFAETRARFAIPVEPVHDLLTGIRRDLEPTRFATWAELREYCYCVAGTVGLIVAPILGCRDSWALEHAVNLGIAMQLTNILRDVGEDALCARLYLPLDEIEAFGCDPEAILAGRPGDRFPDLMDFEIARARALYTDARRGMAALAPSGRLTTLAASRLYAGILTEIEAINYDVYRRRAHVSSTRKLGALPGVAATFVHLLLRPDRAGDGQFPGRGGIPTARTAPPVGVETALATPSGAGAPMLPERQPYG